MIKINKPTKCTPCGTHKCAIPMPIKNQVRHIDICISDIVAALNAGGIITVASCCGHGKINGSIILEDNRWLIIEQKYIENGDWKKSRFLNKISRIKNE